MSSLEFAVFLKKIPKLVWIAVACALAINIFGLTFIFTHYNQEALIAGDGQVYLKLAENLHQGLGFGLFATEGFVSETFRTPGLPFLFAMFLNLGLGLKSYLAFISIVSSIVIPVLSWFIGKTLFNDRVGKLTALLLALEPLLWLHNWTFLTEIPFLILGLFGVVLLIVAYTKKSALSFAALSAGVSFALAAYMRPAAFPLVLLALLAVSIERAYVHKRIVWVFPFVALMMFLCLIPWYERTHEVSGVYSLSGTGWRNVYTDYLASIRAVNNHTQFTDEKEALKQYAMKTWGITRTEINSPAQSEIFKEYALPEIMANKKTVVKLQSILFVSYFTHSDSQRRLQKLGFLPMNSIEKARVSSSRLLIDKGFNAVSDIYQEMKNRYFFPVIERTWTVSVFLLAVVGFFVSRSRARFLVFLLLLTGYLTSSAIGLGVEGRLRLPVLPFYFMLASCGILFLYDLCRLRISTFLWKK